jgi:hypothetical protein
MIFGRSGRRGGGGEGGRGLSVEGLSIFRYLKARRGSRTRRGIMYCNFRKDSKEGNCRIPVG